MIDGDFSFSSCFFSGEAAGFSCYLGLRGAKGGGGRGEEQQHNKTQ